MAIIPAKSIKLIVNGVEITKEYIDSLRIGFKPEIVDAFTKPIQGEKCTSLSEWTTRHEVERFTEYAYWKNLIEEDGASLIVEVRNNDCIAAERILHQRVARNHKWPFCPVHQRNVDLVFSHLDGRDDVLIHIAYWLCKKCAEEK
jgi:hypothetical protein